MGQQFTSMYLDDKGVSSTGIQRIDDKIYYFDPDGKQVVCRFEELPDGSWMYLDDDGVAATGAQKINGQELYFDNNGKQVKNDKVINDDGTINYYTGMSGEKLKNDFGELPDGSWMYLDNQGNAVIGAQKINGQNLYFKTDGRQVKGKQMLIHRVKCTSMILILAS